MTDVFRRGRGPGTAPPCGAGMRPHFSLEERNGCARSKRDAGEPFRLGSPTPPPERHRPGGLRAPYSGLHPRGVLPYFPDHAATGVRKEKQGHTTTTYESRTHVIRCGEAPSLFPQTWAHPVGDHRFTGAPARSTPVPRSNRHRCVDLSRPSIFSFDRERPFSFRCIEKKMGVHFPRRKAAHSPLNAQGGHST